MSHLKTWISAFRLRTLPLAASAVIVGAGLADLHGAIDWIVTLLCIATAVCLQVLSNLSNDYGDFIKGTDNDNRIGNMRALQSGNVSPAQMRLAIVTLVVLSLISGISLLYHSTEGNINYAFVAFFITGLVAIAAAIKYTIGRNAYGYSGLGDIAVFLFFGPVAVVGTFMLNAHMQWNMDQDWRTVMPACGIGLLCTAVLNTNNIRDIENDAAHGKRTIPVQVGLQKARVYHTVLILLGIGSLFAYSCFNLYDGINLLQLPAAFLIIRNLINVWKTEPSPRYNGYLKQLSLGILLFSIVFVITNIAANVVVLISVLNGMFKK